MELNFLIMLVGWIAVVTSSFCTLPQLIKSIKTKSVDDLSYSGILLMIWSQSIWAVYGGLQGDIPLVAASIIPIIVNLWLLVVYYRHKKEI
jgi:MtN3 and saliva related transmembrane protein